MPTFTHAKKIAGYNWTLYAGAAAALVVGAVIIALPGVPPVLQYLAAAGMAVVLWFTGASFWAFHWMFDRSELLPGRWLLQEVPATPQKWIQINAGLGETTIPVETVFPDTTGTTLDIFDPALMNEPALARARAALAGSGRPAARPDALPFANGEQDLVLVTLAAHEIRDRQARAKLFAELARVAAPTARIVVVEHLRDLAAALAFGPGMFHFYPHSEWLQLGNAAGLKLLRERHITPFVRVFIFTR